MELKHSMNIYAHQYLSHFNTEVIFKEEEEEEDQNSGQRLFRAHFMPGVPTFISFAQPNTTQISTELSSFSKSKAQRVGNDGRKV